MNHRHTLAFFSLCFVAACASAQDAARSPFKSIPSGFEENRGQWDGDAHYQVRSAGMVGWVTGDGMVMDFKGVGVNEGKGHVVRMRLQSSLFGRPISKVVEPRAGVRNYIIGNDASRYVRGAKVYREVVVENIQQGVDARWTMDQGAPRYDLIVSPGADPNSIALSFEGARRLSVDSHGLRLETSVGTFHHRELVAYQGTGAARRQVPCSFHVQGSTVRFNVGPYDKRQPLVIDPLIAATHLGGSDPEEITDMSIRPSGELVVGGKTLSEDFPTTVGAYNRVNPIANPYAVFVAQVSQDLDEIHWSTFFGGSGSVDQAVVYGEDLNDLALAPNGDVVLGGLATSPDFPLVNPIDSTLAANNDEVPFDGFISVLSANGEDLLFSTFFGLNRREEVTSVAVDSLGRIVFAGETNGVITTTRGAFDTSYNSNGDGFVARLTEGRSALSFSSYFGGGSFDSVVGLALDASDNIYIAGATYSTTLPSTVGSFQPSLGGSEDAYLFRFSPNFTTVTFGTYVGGASVDRCMDLAISPGGLVGITGVTYSTGFPTTGGVHDRTFASIHEGFATVFNASGVVQYSTLLGTSGQTFPEAACFDFEGRFTIAGTAGANSIPTTTTAFDDRSRGLDGFLTQFTPAGTGLRYSTRFGSAKNDKVRTLVEQNGMVYIAGVAEASVTTLFGAIDRTVADSHDGFIAKMCAAYPAINPSKRSVISGIENLNANLALVGPAPTGGTTVQLATSTSKVFAPETSTFAEGATKRNAALTTYTVEQEVPALIGMTRPGWPEMWSRLYLRAGGLSSLTLAEDTVKGGFSTVGFAKLSAGALGATRTVTLSSNSPRAIVPASVNITLISGSFSIQTQAVTARTLATISATLGNETRTAVLTINP